MANLNSTVSYLHSTRQARKARSSKWRSTYSSFWLWLRSLSHFRPTVWNRIWT